MAASRKHKFSARLWEFDAEGYADRRKNNANLGKEVEKESAKLIRFCQAAAREVFQLWLHLKAMYIFVDSVLRFGVPPHFRCFLLKPKKASFEMQLRNTLEHVLTSGAKTSEPYSKQEAGEHDGPDPGGKFYNFFCALIEHLA